LDIAEEAIVAVVVAVEADFVGIDGVVVVPDGDFLIGAGVTLGFGLLHVGGYHILLISVLEGGGTGDAGTQLEHIPILPYQLVGVAGHVGTGTHKAHVADEHVPQLGQLVQLVAAQLGPQRGNATLPSHTHRRAAMVDGHRAELVHLEKLGILAHPLLYEQHGTTRHLHLHQYGYNKQYRREQNQAEERDNTVEEEFEEHIGEVYEFISLGV